MIITPHPYGRMANRLALASHWIAHVEETSDKYLHLCFADYARFFEGTKGHAFLRYRSTTYQPHQHKKIFGCVNIWNTNDKRNETYHIDADDFLSRQSDTRYLFTVGWSFRTSREVMQRHHAMIVKFFKPVAKHLANIDRCIEQARNGCDHLIGIHIRQTDYKKFNDGKWFYPMSVYRRVMEDVQSQLPGHTRFLICTDGTLDFTAFNGLDFVSGTGHPVEDCYELSRCDYILGPPSTYTHWASYYGKVPLMHIKDANLQIPLERFTPR